ncbi:heme o synthase [Rhodohalobacter mucosus]|uniref:Protoheme IX farnesyltransferase n=1 Tax=Rhodohalobacter mucosus TaxID=2079485 RepID=A0A316TV10_9BACT|nr:heme o synthase [Rhodohalobacter mucosus]PWN06174.1 protoheme IX farnesyltransferase [Rhodohalobacter mucosus]
MSQTDTEIRSAPRTFLDIASDYFELTKPGITFTVVASMLIGFLMGSAAGFSFTLMLHATLGTWLIASGTAAHNMFMERGVDGLMRRTSKRPLPDSRVSARNGFIFSMGLILAGLIYLIVLVNFVAGLVSLATTIIYLFAYTPLKRISALNVFVGAVPGALPVVGGWAAATGTVFEHGMWILFGLIYCWQIPHVMAIAWVCRDDYEHAGFKMLPKNDPGGLKTVLWIMIPLLILIPTVYKLYVMELLGWLYLSGSIITTLGFIWYGIRFSYYRDNPTAKSLMFASFVYLPIIWIFIFLDWMIL